MNLCLWKTSVQLLRRAFKLECSCSFIRDVHKRRPQSGRVCPLQKFCGQGEFFRCGRPQFFVQKTKDFSKFMICPQGKGGLSQCRHFVDKGEGGQFFAILCGRLLWTVLYLNYFTQASSITEKYS